MRRLLALPILSIFAAVTLAACAQWPSSPLPAQLPAPLQPAGTQATTAVVAQQAPAARPAVQTATWVAREFRFHTGETLPAVTIAYRTLGNPAGEAVMLLHGTTGNGSNFLTAAFADEMFGPGQPLDAARYFIILPDSIGTGDSSKPSDGLRAKFPRYSYEDMVDAQYRLMTEGLGIRHLRLVLGNSMGGMQAWIWATRYPKAMDAVVPMASMPVAMSGRNWMTRRLIIDSVRNDPAYRGGDYVLQPASLQFASVMYGVATNGGDQALYAAAPTRAKADALLDARLKSPFAGDANDHVYQWDASRDYDPSSRLGLIQAYVLAINSADDERNPPELGVMEVGMARIAHARLLVVAGSEKTAGHGTTAQAKWWKEDFRAWFGSVPKQAQ
jgi:homoserine O-acetyltransferase